VIQVHDSVAAGNQGNHVERAESPPSSRRSPKRILVVEDSPDLAQGLCDNLALEGYEASASPDGESALRMVDTFSPHLIILDLMLPGMGGFSFLNTFRSMKREEPVLILSARSEQADKLRGFRIGADDFVTKPFDLFELLARVEALLRRTYGEPDESVVIQFGDVTLDPPARKAHRDGREVELSPKEFDLAVALVRRAGTVLSREDLLRDVWGYKAAVPTRTVDTHVSQLRKKLELVPGSPKHFTTVPKVGYRFDF
jgi:DNA-binding response OmpR family regulator